MEANRWYMCRYDYELGDGIIFEGGEIYFFEPAGNGISTIDEEGDTYYFNENNRSTFNDLFRLATNEEIHNPTKVLFKEKDSVESQVLTKREQFAMAAMQGLLANQFNYQYYGTEDGWGITAKESVKQADALIKALES